MNFKNNTYKYFVRGPISTEIITGSISDNQSNPELGAQGIFLGKVRADFKNGLTESKIKNRVASIYYTAYEEMAEKEIETIKENVTKKFGLFRLHILHSIGEVKRGEISVLVMVSSAHRGECFQSLGFIVNEIKNKVPIWKKEIYEDGSYRWV